MIDQIVIVTYFVALLGVGWYAKRRAVTADDYLVAGRRLGYGMYTGTLAAVVLGGASTVGGVRLGYLYGISGLWLVAMLGLGIVVLSAVLAGKITRTQVFSVPELVGRYFGRMPRVVSGIVMAAYDLMVAVTATMAIGAVLSVMLELGNGWSILIGGGIVVIYTTLGGMWSITLTDIVQFCLMTVGIFALLLPFGLTRAGGWAGLQSTLPASYFDLTAIGIDTIVTYFLIYFFGILIGQDIWQRTATARSPRVARRAGLATGAYCLIYAVAGAVIGMCARTLLPDLGNPDDAFAAITVHVLPIGLAGLVIAAALAAIMSTASACLMATSTVLSRDVLPGKKEGITRERIVTVCVGIAVVALSLVVRDVVAGLTIAYNLLVGGLFVPIVGGIAWRRASSRGALAAMGAGGVVVAGLMLSEGLLANSPIYWGLAASAAAFVAGSLLWPDDATAETKT